MAGQLEDDSDRTVLRPGFLSAVPVRHEARAAGLACAPIREIGTVFGTLLGVFLLKERQGLRRIAMSTIITFGIISVAFSG
ncbi:hypothetical protein [Paenibacillus mendelii]|uniref:EamA domain-containing protein n=1 Tax=Paenibacillus mendelii TaxID=206163 RepID=A0ABV6JEE3_9BACL|nr:hypothetical protein [Paenibacillus mendelii]MCQ6563365.1 hypothetical protein [Paenibacillus mendelii]